MRRAITAREARWQPIINLNSPRTMRGGNDAVGRKCHTTFDFYGREPCRTVFLSQQAHHHPVKDHHGQPESIHTAHMEAMVRASCDHPTTTMPPLIPNPASLHFTDPAVAPPRSGATVRSPRV